MKSAGLITAKTSLAFHSWTIDTGPLVESNQDIWDDIKPVLNSRERADYPTQKPVELIQRIITSCTAFGDLVLDPFVGSGTTAVACHNLSRNWIAIDSSIKACRLTLRRLHAAGVMTKIILPDSKQIVKDSSIYRTPKILIS